MPLKPSSVTAVLQALDASMSNVIGEKTNPNRIGVIGRNRGHAKS